MLDSFMAPSFLGQGGTSYSQLYSQFPDPFYDYSSNIQPKDMKDVLKWAEYLWSRLGAWRMCSKRVVRYFLTDLNLTDGGEDELDKYKDFLTHTLKLMEALALLGDDFFAYGNSFSSLYIPFRRFLICPKCYLQRPISKVKYTFHDLSFTSICPKCSYKGEFLHVDRRSMDQEKFKMIRWSPHDIRLRYHMLSGQTDYVWDIPTDFSEQVDKGIPFYVENTHWEVLKAVHKDESFKFNDGFIYHMKEPTLAGVQNRGWGIPSILYNFSQAYRIQILKRHDEALCMDYIVPFRVFSPASGSSQEADPMMDMNMGDFSYKVQEMLAEHRRDPTSWHSIPFDINYQAIGGEATNLVPVDLMNQAIDELLNESGYPAEMYKGTIQVQAAPTALRLFQQTWTHLVAFNNDFIDWLLETIAISLNWERIRGKLQPVTLADDLEKRQLQLQLAAGQLISKSTALAPLGIKYPEEIEKIIQEDQQAARAQEKAQMEEQERQQAMSTMMGQDAASMGGGMGGATPQDVQGDAQQMAQQLFGMDPTTRRRYITNLKHQDPNMHALVTAALDDMRQQAGSEGIAMAQQQAGGMGAPGGGMPGSGMM